MTETNQILLSIAQCVERGKVNRASPYPPDLRERDGADELVRRAIDLGLEPQAILTEGLMAGMSVVGEEFRARRIFVPEVLMAAKAMTAGMEHLRPFFASSQATHRGAMILGTVLGDLHDIGKKLVGMMVEGAGWEVIDLGTDVAPEDFVAAVERRPDCVVGLSALLTTTMMNMKETVARLKDAYPETKIIIGGAPVTGAFAREIGADAYAPDPPGAVDFLNSTAAEK